MEHAAGSDEPLLWSPDSVADPVSGVRGDARYLDQLAGLVSMIEA